MRLAVDGMGGVGVGRLDQAEDPARVLVDPVPEVLDAVGVCLSRSAAWAFSTSLMATPYRSLPVSR
jgi:hypothetical protein